MSDPKQIGEGIGPGGSEITDENIHELDLP
jgi:hypothetical protein